ncbi:hypothetical protein VZT92_012665 [Zoarces viviparus]|uniref:Uncharacterized protein n=1 Tax=Zoarces viviparus TaxID=48416 RepID=A0AAW1F1M3_ZOAVI
MRIPSDGGEVLRCPGPRGDVAPVYLAGGRQDQSDDQEPGAADCYTQPEKPHHSRYKDKLQEFRRRSPTTGH